MPVIARIHDFIPFSLIQSAQVDAEFNQLVAALAGTSSANDFILKYSHATDPVLNVDQLGAGAVQRWKVAGVEVASVENNGSFKASIVEIAGVAPRLDFTDSDGEDFRFLCNNDNLALSNLTGPVSYITFRGGANDDITVTRPMTLATAGDLRATRPRFTTSIDDTNGNELFGLTATGSAVNEFTVANAGTGAGPTLSATGSDTDISIVFSPKGAGTVTTDCSVTNTATVANVGFSNVNSTGTPAAGFGQSQTYRLESSTTVNRDASRISTSWVIATDGSRTSAIDYATVDNGNALRDVLRISGNAANTGASFNLLGTNGAESRNGILTELLTLNTGSTTTDTTIDLPANSIIQAVSTRVTTTITTATSFSVGDPTTAARFSASAGGMTAGSTRVGLQHMQGSVATDAAGPVQTTAAKVRITTNVNPGAGAIRITIHYVNFIPATG